MKIVDHKLAARHLYFSAIHIHIAHTLTNSAAFTKKMENRAKLTKNKKSH